MIYYFWKGQAWNTWGEAMLAVMKYVISSLISLTSSLEIIWIRMWCRFRTCLIRSCYRPPKSLVGFVEKLNEVLDYIYSRLTISQ